MSETVSITNSLQELHPFDLVKHYIKLVVCQWQL